MTSPTTRRPLPALVFLLALTLLAALVWWRVLHRDSGHTATKATCTTTTTQAPKQLPEPAAITLTVVNSTTTRQGIAGAARKILLKDGFQIPGAAINDDKEHGAHGVLPGVGEIRYGPLGASAARLVGYYLPGAKLVTMKASDAVVVVSLGTKYRAPATSAKVSAALKTAGITLVRTSGAPGTGESSSASC